MLKYLFRRSQGEPDARDILHDYVVGVSSSASLFPSEPTETYVRSDIEALSSDFQWVVGDVIAAIASRAPQTRVYDDLVRHVLGRLENDQPTRFERSGIKYVGNGRRE